MQIAVLAEKVYTFCDRRNIECFTIHA